MKNANTINPWRTAIWTLGLAVVLFLPAGLVTWLWGPKPWGTKLVSGLLGGLVVGIVFYATHLPASLWWVALRSSSRPALGHDRGRFVFYVLLPVIASGVVATLAAPWSGWPVWLCALLSLDDLLTAAVSLALPAGGRFNEVMDQSDQRWVQVTYFGQRFFYQPGRRRTLDHLQLKARLSGTKTALRRHHSRRTMDVETTLVQEKE